MYGYYVNSFFNTKMMWCEYTPCVHRFVRFERSVRLERVVSASSRKTTSGMSVGLWWGTGEYKLHCSRYIFTLQVETQLVLPDVLLSQTNASVSPSTHGPCKEPIYTPTIIHGRVEIRFKGHEVTVCLVIVSSPKATLPAFNLHA